MQRYFLFIRYNQEAKHAPVDPFDSFEAFFFDKSRNTHCFSMFALRPFTQFGFSLVGSWTREIFFPPVSQPVSLEGYTGQLLHCIEIHILQWNGKNAKKKHDKTSRLQIVDLFDTSLLLVLVSLWCSCGVLNTRLQSATATKVNSRGSPSPFGTPGWRSFLHHLTCKLLSERVGGCVATVRLVEEGWVPAPPACLRACLDAFLHVCLRCGRYHASLTKPLWGEHPYCRAWTAPGKQYESVKSLWSFVLHLDKIFFIFFEDPDDTGLVCLNIELQKRL